MVEFEGFVLGMGLISFLALYASATVKKDEVPAGRYAEKVLLHFLGIFGIIGIALLLVLEAENTVGVAHLLTFANSWFVGVVSASTGVLFFYLLYVLIKSIEYFNKKKKKREEDSER